VAVARNVAIAQSVGEFFVPLDADDALHPEFVEKTLAVMLSTPDISFVYTNYELFGDVKDRVEADEYEYWRYLYDKNLCASTSLIKKRAWLDAGGYNPNMIWGFEDWEFWISCGAKGHFGKKLAKDLFLFQCENKLFKPLKNAVSHRSRGYFWNSPFYYEKTDVKLRSSEKWEGSQASFNVITDKPFLVDLLILKNIK
jgi:glycosyltransferase involved in cell wall biosynthesis